MTVTSLVTGASSGLGAEYARQLAAKGDAVVLVARDRDRLEALAAQLRERHRVDVEVLAADLLDPAQLRTVEDRLADRNRPVTTLVNNAGFGLRLGFEANDVEDEVRHLRLHDEVPMRLIHAALPTMTASGGGRIINVASVAAFIPRSTYGASKLWLISFSRWANAEYRRRGIVVTAVCPGFVHTEFHQRLGLPPGEEGVPTWMWLDAPTVVAGSLRDVARGKAISVPSLRYKALVLLSRMAPPGLAARAGRRGR